VCKHNFRNPHPGCDEFITSTWPCVAFSGRPGTPASLRKKKDEEDLTKNMEEPVPVPVVEEVSVPKLVRKKL